MREADRIKLKNVSGYSYQREYEEFEQFLAARVRVPWYRRLLAWCLRGTRGTP